MRKLGFSTVCVVVVVGLCVGSGPVLAAKTKRIEAFKAQTTKSFVNEETVPAAGLVVALSSAGEVKTEEESGRAGPFRDVKGNGSSKITLTNAESPVEPGNEAIELVFGTYSKKISVKSWWWIDDKGKRIGKKIKG